MTEPLLSIRGLRVEFPKRRTLTGALLGQKPMSARAVDGVDLDVYPRETVGLVGESGSGKTTLGRAILSLYQPSAGQVLFKGQNVSTGDAVARQKLHRNLQMVFQNPYASLNPRMTVAQTIDEALRFHTIVPAQDIPAEIERLLGLVGLTADMANRYPQALSGGQCQRVGLARAMSVQPSMLVLDEAVAALDVSIQAQVLNLLLDLREAFGLAMIFIAHELSVVRHISHRVAVMYLGKIVEIGRRDDIFERPKHPYTQSLLAAVPRLGTAKRKRQAVLQGDIPSPYNIPTGCPFQTRCPSVQDICRSVAPPSITVSADHKADCHFVT
ncbi:MAG: ABC transporter ATP-binding protein [Aestuariivirga sp.]|uniref:ABC transporter ATP-binding protein n=1 Tax=Aestuariivirga sp. TaxID=2650926 RepID=UPI0030191388